MSLAGGLASNGTSAPIGGLPLIDLRAGPYNVVADGNFISDANITTGTADLTTTTSTPWTILDVGKAIGVAGAGGNTAGELRTTIASFVSSSHVVLAANATKTVTSRTVADAVTNGTTTITSNTANFVTGAGGDVGAPVTGTNIPQYTVITSVTNSTTAVMSQPAMDSATGSLTISYGCQWGTDNILGINLWLSGTAATGANGVLPAGRIICTQPWRVGINGVATRTTQVLQAAGGRSTTIVWINSNAALNILPAAGSSAATQIPQLILRDIGWDGLYRGVGTDGIFNRVGAASAFWSLPYPFSAQNGVTFPTGTHGNAYEMSSGTYGRTVNDCVTNGTTTITSATANFVSGNDAGKTAQGTNIPSGTTIASVTNTTTAVLSQAANASGTGVLTLGPATLTDAGRTVADGVTNGTTTITSATLGFTDGSVNRTVTGADFSGGTTIASVTNATTAILNQAAANGGSGRTITLGPAPFTNNQYLNALVFIDEDKAVANTPTGSGYGRIQGSTTTGILQVGTWYGTKRNNAYQPSGAAVRYRIHAGGNVWGGVHHRVENGYFYRPAGYVAFPTCGEFIYPVLEATGQPGASAHNDTFGSAGTHAVIDHPRYINCSGNLGDFAATVPGRFPTAVFEEIEDIGRVNTGGLFIGGIGSRVIGSNIDDPAQTGTGYDATTVHPNRGGNMIMGMSGSFIQAYVSGFNGLYGDTIGLNSLNDAPLTQSGALTAIAAFSSGVAQQITQAGRAAQMMGSVTFTPTGAAAATCVVAISPDNTTFTNVIPAMTVPLGTALDSFILPISWLHPAGWWVKLTVTNATIGTFYIVQ